jgi:hypothetical protein
MIKDKVLNNVRILFVLAFVISGLLWGYASRLFLEPMSQLEIALFAYFVIPAILLVGGGLFVLLRQEHWRIYLWAASAYWLFITLGELSERDWGTRSVVLYVSMWVISAMCVVFLLFVSRSPAPR